MRCATCGTEIQGRPTNCPRCGTRLYYDEADAAAQGQAPAAPQGAWQGSPFAQPQYPGYPAYPQEGQAAPPGYPPMYPQQMPPGAQYGAAAPPSMPYGAYAPPSMPQGTGYQGYPPAYGPGPGQGQPYPPYGVGAPATIPFGAPPAPPRRRANPLVIVLSIVAAVVVIAAAGVGAVYLTQHGGSTSPTAGTSGTPTATATLAPTVLYQNAMTTPDSGWAQDQNCFFRSDGYHIVGFHLCFAPISDQQNVDIKVDMTALTGDLGSPHGIFFRHNGNPDRYEFDLDAYGHWVFFKCIAAQNKCQTVVDYRPNSAIHGGLKASNTLEVIAVGSHFTFLVNGTQVGTADDSSLSVGAMGLAGNDSSEVVFTNLTITMPR